MSSSSSNSFYYQITKLSGQSSFRDWKMKIVGILHERGLYGYIDGSTPKPIVSNEDDTKTRESLKQWEKENRMALNQLILTIADDNLYLIREIEAASEAWRIINDTYAPKGSFRRVALRAKLMSTSKYNEAESLSDYIRKIKEIVMEMRAAEIRIEDDELSETLLAFMPESYSNIVTVLGSDRPLVSEKVITGLLNEEARRLMNRSNRIESAMINTAVGNNGNSTGRSCSHCKRPGHNSTNCWELIGYPPNPRHTRYQRNDKRPGDGKKQGPTALIATATATTTTTTTSTRSAHTRSTVGDSEGNDIIFFLDSGASVHLIKTNQYWNQQSMIVNRPVVMGDNNTIMGIEWELS